MNKKIQFTLNGKSVSREAAVCESPARQCRVNFVTMESRKGRYT